MIGPAMAWNLYGTLEEWGTSPFRPYDHYGTQRWFALVNLPR